MQCMTITEGKKMTESGMEISSDEGLKELLLQIRAKILVKQVVLKELEDKVVAYYTTGWRKWFNYGASREDILKEGIRSMFHRANMEHEIETLKVFEDVVTRARSKGSKVFISIDNYSLIYN